VSHAPELTEPIGHGPIDRRFVGVLAIVLVVIGLVGIGFRAERFLRGGLSADDFTHDFVSARALRAGGNPYAELQTLLPFTHTHIVYYTLNHHQRNPHSPSQIVLALPFTAMPYREARVAWLLVSSALLAVAMYWVVRGLGAGVRVALICAAASLALPIVQNDLVYGQSGGVMLALLVPTWLRSRKRDSLRAGIPLGIAAGIKLFPAFLLIPLVRMKRWRAIAAALISGAIVNGLALAMVGWGPARFWLKSAGPENFRFWRAAPVNISLPGSAFRWLSTSFWRISNLDVPSLALVIAILLMVIAALIAYLTPARWSGDPYLAALPLMLLAGPLTGDQSLPLMLPFVCAGTIAIARSVRSRSRYVGWLILVVLVIGTLPGVPSAVPGLSVAVIVLGFGLPTLALLGAVALDLVTFSGRQRLPGGSASLSPTPG